MDTQNLKFMNDINIAVHYSGNSFWTEVLCVKNYVVFITCSKTNKLSYDATIINLEGETIYRIKSEDENEKHHFKICSDTEISYNSEYCLHVFDFNTQQETMVHKMSDSNQNTYISDDKKSLIYYLDDLIVSDIETKEKLIFKKSFRDFKFITTGSTIAIWYETKI